MKYFFLNHTGRPVPGRIVVVLHLPMQSVPNTVQIHHYTLIDNNDCQWHVDCIVRTPVSSTTIFYITSHRPSILLAIIMVIG